AQKRDALRDRDPSRERAGVEAYRVAVVGSVERRAQRRVAPSATDAERRRGCGRADGPCVRRYRRSVTTRLVSVAIALVVVAVTCGRRCDQHHRQHQRGRQRDRAPQTPLPHFSPPCPKEPKPRSSGTCDLSVKSRASATMRNQPRSAGGGPNRALREPVGGADRAEARPRPLTFRSTFCATVGTWLGRCTFVSMT